MKQLSAIKPILLGVFMGTVACATLAACNEDMSQQGVDRTSAKAPGGKPEANRATTVAEVLDPQTQLQWMAREAVKRSSQVGAIRLLADAAAFDVDETRGAALPQVSFNGTLGPAATRYTGIATSKGVQTTASVNVSGLLYDGGRIDQLTQWRRELANAARFSAQSARDQVVLEAVSTALERNRYRVQAQVYQQYARKMGCLVEALEQIVSEDRGRASELLQARKTLSQAELSRDNALALSRQTDIRLRKLIGDQAPATDGITVPLGETMDRGEVLRLLHQSSELAQIRAQADASERYSQAVLAGQKPQLTWMAGSSGSIRGDTKSLSVQAGLSVSYSVFNGNSDQAAARAADKRAQSARQQYDEVLGARMSRVVEVHEAATSALDRAKRYVDVLKDSDRVRNATFQQWSQLGRRSLFDVMSAEGDHFNLRISYVNALHDGYQANAQLRAMGGGMTNWLGVGE